MDVINVGDVEDEYHSRWVGAMGVRAIKNQPIY